jgi:hypothetical protein
MNYKAMTWSEVHAEEDRRVRYDDTEHKPMQRRLPLTEEQIASLFDVKVATLHDSANIFKLIDAVRMIEKAHGIA